MEGTQTPTQEYVNISGFNLPSNYNPEFDPRVKKTRDELMGQLNTLRDELEKAKPILNEWKEIKESQKSFEQKYVEAEAKRQELEQKFKQTAKKAVIDSLITDKLTELSYAGTRILPQFLKADELYQFEDVNSETFKESLKKTMDNAFMTQTVSFKALNTPSAFPTRTPGMGGAPPVMTGSAPVVDQSEGWADNPFMQGAYINRK